jgi:hypothetical protein
MPRRVPRQNSDPTSLRSPVDTMSSQIKGKGADMTILVPYQREKGREGHARDRCDELAAAGPCRRASPTSLILDEGERDAAFAQSAHETEGRAPGAFTQNAASRRQVLANSKLGTHPRKHVDVAEEQCKRRHHSQNSAALRKAAETSYTVKRKLGDEAPRKQGEGRSAAHEMHKATEKPYTVRRTLSDKAPRKRMEGHSAASPNSKSLRAHKTNKSIASSESDLMAMERTAMGTARPSSSAPSLASRRGQNLPSLAIEDQNVHHLRRELMDIFQDSISSKAIVITSQSSPSSAGTAECASSARLAEGSSAQQGAYLARILLLVFHVCWVVVMLPVTIVKAVLSDQPPWCAPSPRVESPMRPARIHRFAYSLSGSSSTWQSIVEILDSLSFDTSV